MQEEVREAELTCPLLSFTSNFQDLLCTKHLLVIHCCIANYHRLSDLKQHMFIISCFLGVRSPSTA